MSSRSGTDDRVRRSVAGFAWVAAAALFGFVVSFVFAGLLHLPRRLFLIPYLGLGTVFLYVFLRWARLDVAGLVRHRWRIGIAGAALVGAVSVGSVLAQPASRHATGWMLWFDLVWSGVGYGAMDALLLSVVPMLAVWKATRELGWGRGLRGTGAARALGVAASIVVTAAYHLGYPEYRGPQVMGAVGGNGIVTLGYALTGSPLTPVLGHIVLHVAALLHGPGTVAQLPPHL